MIKYRTNSKIGHFFGTHTEVAHDQLTEWFTLLGIKCLVSDGIIVEIQEPEFTRDDMLDFGMNCHHILDDIKTMNIPLAFDEWVKLKQ